MADLFKGSDPKLTRTADPPLDRRLMPRLVQTYLYRMLGGVGLCGRQGSGLLQRSQELLDLPPLRLRSLGAMPGTGLLPCEARATGSWFPLRRELQTLDQLLSCRSIPLTTLYGLHLKTHREAGRKTVAEHG